MSIHKLTFLQTYQSTTTPKDACCFMCIHDAYSMHKNHAYFSPFPTNKLGSLKEECVVRLCAPHTCLRQRLKLIKSNNKTLSFAVCSSLSDVWLWWWVICADKALQVALVLLENLTGVAQSVKLCFFSAILFIVRSKDWWTRQNFLNTNRWLSACLIPPMAYCGNGNQACTNFTKKKIYITEPYVCTTL